MARRDHKVLQDQLECLVRPGLLAHQAQPAHKAL